MAEREETFLKIYIERFFLLVFLIKIVYTFIVCVMHDSLYGNISGHNRCNMLGERYKLRTCQCLWDTTVHYCPAPSVIRAYKIFSYKSEVKAWWSARHESSSCTCLLTPLQWLGFYDNSAWFGPRTDCDCPLSTTASISCYVLSLSHVQIAVLFSKSSQALSVWYLYSRRNRPLGLTHKIKVKLELID
jgi:hypothetical protein